MEEKKSYPLVSVIINNYNYGRFLAEAINSVLNQTYQNIELIVVDDGSIDNSREVIASYGETIISVLKENGGQASAINQGFAASQGEIVIFLDSDDILLPEIVQSVVTAFESQSNVAKVQYRLQKINAIGQLTEEIVPAKHWHMPTGDLREHILKVPNYVWPPTSGNAFASVALHQILPMPESIFRVAVDIYLNDLAVMFGLLISLDEVGAYYRMHGDNDSKNLKTVNLNILREDSQRFYAVHSKRKEILKKLSPHKVIDTESKDLKLIMGKIISLKLDPANHPFQDNLFLLCLRGFIYSVFNIFNPQERWHVELLMSVWFILMFFAPKPMAQYLADNLLHAEKRNGLMNKLRTIVQMVG
ncbi:glycosyltransferase [Tolypothrix sp. PCC 7910]|uniref:glycosyltransferase family 2 protein n=1 Tax=Tolypothrix sp. PCC 7910 TaxID=2099387 RepID=UPI00142790CA|nr:glycosyltransferase [Tolypothrix sp. PCC 7910]QIR37806.1 glycosyltransferase [Tolypothrix sp. PCC 7910]